MADIGGSATETETMLIIFCYSQLSYLVIIFTLI